MAIAHRYDFVLFFEVVNGNPNGDPDAGNMPRIDPETANGIVTDVCIKRKIRNYVQIAREGADGYDIFVTEGAILNDKQQKVYEDKGLAKNDREKARAFMCERYFDVRTFGAVMDTGDYKCGQVRGPVQLCFGRSVDSVLQQEITITRMAATNASEKDKDDATKNRTMGRKYVIPYGLYRMEGFVSPAFAQKTGFSEEDLKLLWEALLNMFEIDRSAARGRMATRKLYVFEHESQLGNAPAYALFDQIGASLLNADAPARRFEDYAITVGALPAGITLHEMR
jgi:CRISPR-associated protein Csd2